MAPEPASAHDAPGAPYAQPTPRWFYVHDDLTDEVNRRAGAGSPAAKLAQELLGLLRADGGRVIVLTLGDQLESIVRQGPFAPFDLALGIGLAGERVAEQLQTRTGWFLRVRRIGITREEDGRGGYSLVSTVAESLADQLAGLEGCRSLAVVDDTVFSGLTIRGVLGLLPPAFRSRTRVFCLRGVGETLDTLTALCPVTAGVAAPGRRLDDVSFINATGLVLRVSIRRRGQPPLAFFDRPEWLRSWFLGYDRQVLDLCRRLNALLEPPAKAAPSSARRDSDGSAQRPSQPAGNDETVHQLEDALERDRHAGRGKGARQDGADIVEG